MCVRTECGVRVGWSLCDCVTVYVSASVAAREKERLRLWMARVWVRGRRTATEREKRGKRGRRRVEVGRRSTARETGHPQRSGEREGEAGGGPSWHSRGAAAVTRKRDAAAPPRPRARRGRGDRERTLQCVCLRRSSAYLGTCVSDCVNVSSRLPARRVAMTHSGQGTAAGARSWRRRTMKRGNKE